MDIQKQLEIIKKGTVEILPEEELIKKLKKGKPLIVKWGADPSAPDIHLGHTVVLHKLRQLQDLGHNIIFLIGDFTAQIGDPTGKSETRKPLTKKEVAQNAKTYQKQVFKILNPRKTKTVFNSKWLGKMGLGDMLKLSSQYTVARMLERKDFKQRFENEADISVLEFMYPLLQGYDSVHLRADIEIGGTDQKFNMLVGRTLQERYGKEPQVVLTMPLLEGTDGIQKMSKSLGNYIGITEPPAEIFGKTMSISDTLMLRYFDLLTNIPKEMVVSLHPKEAKKMLAKMLVTQFYNAKIAEDAEKEFEAMFKDGGLPQDLPLKIIKEKEIWVCKLLVDTGLAPSTTEARRLIKQGGVRIDNKVITDEQTKIILDKEKIVNVGRRRFVKVKCA